LKNQTINKKENLIGSLKNKSRTVFIFLFFISANLFAQNSYTISGTVLDDQNQPIIGVFVLIKGTTTGVVSDEKGNFSLKTNKLLPVRLVISFTGLRTQEIDVFERQALQVSLSQSLNKLEEVVVSASQKSEVLSKVPISLQTISSTELKSIPGGSFYNAISTLQGVNTINASIAFTVYNTRGFQSSTNLRFVQLVDGADNSSPELGIPIGNTIGPGELDVKRVELIPGASSAIYGLNSSNGLINLITKDPFTSQGLSVSLKSGVNNANSPLKTSENIQASPYNNFSLRYAKALTDKIAFKVNLGYLRAQDWVSGDVNDYQNYNGKGIYDLIDPGYDGANVYGDEGGLSNNLILKGVPTHVSRTGYLEKDLTNYNSKLLHADASLVYKISDSTRISYTYRVGEMDGIITRYNRLKFDNFVVQQHEVEFKSPSFSFRSYINTENSGDSYNIRFLADGLNTAASTNANWNTNYIAAYNAAIAVGQSVNQAYQTARAAADINRFQPETARFDSAVNAIKQNPNWKTGAKFLAKGYLWHNEAIYDLSSFTKEVADLIIGADYRYTQVKSDGTIYADTTGGKPVSNVKFGGFIQAARNLGDYFRLVGSVRFDKDKYFNPKFTERVGLIFAPNKTNNYHLSYQNGYRFPTFYEAWTNVTVAAGIFVGGIQQNVQP
jgi:outer membrane receptor protein involved in Fe transport